MKNNHSSIAITTLVLAALVLATATAAVSPVLGSNVSLSGFSVTPAQAPKGASVTGTVTVQNLDTGRPVTVTVTFYDGGAPAGTSSATTVAKGEVAVVQASFTTTTAGPHCYAASAGSAAIGYCEPGGHLLGGVSTPNFALLATTVSLASIGTAGLLLALLRRRTI